MLIFHTEDGDKGDLKLIEKYNNDDGDDVADNEAESDGV